MCLCHVAAGVVKILVLAITVKRLEVWSWRYFECIRFRFVWQLQFTYIGTDISRMVAPKTPTHNITLNRHNEQNLGQPKVTSDTTFCFCNNPKLYVVGEYRKTARPHVQNSYYNNEPTWTRESTETGNYLKVTSVLCANLSILVVSEDHPSFREYWHRAVWKDLIKRWNEEDTSFCLGMRKIRAFRNVSSAKFRNEEYSLFWLDVVVNAGLRRIRAFVAKFGN